jgi:hypothetical protein
LKLRVGRAAHLHVPQFRGLPWRLADPLYRARLALDAEYLEKIIEEALGFALFIVGIGPFFRKRLGASFDFIPAQTQIISPAM